ncbi:MAG: tetratricopeptide repeat protein [Candidatus Brocadia sp.]|nr:tetratricopeptide repeat protein [Candidatus Brocadia sp.]
MTMGKWFKIKYVKLLVFLALFMSIAGNKLAHGVENQYKYTKHEERFQKSSYSQFKDGLSQTISGLEQKSDNLEAMSQNLEGRINLLASEKDKLSKAYVQMKAKQLTLEKEHAKLKKKTASLEVACKKLASKTMVATTSKKPKAVAQKKPVTKTAQKKTSAKPQSTAKTASGKKVSGIKKTEVHSPSQSYPPIAPERKTSEEQKKETVSGLDVKKINEKGIEYGKKGMYDQAIKEFQKVAAIEPDMANIHYNLGLAYKKKGMLSDANREFAEYERLKGQNN